MEIYLSLDPSVGKNLDEYVEICNQIPDDLGLIYIHEDVMDGIFVERSAVNDAEHSHVIAHAKKPIDTHLMIENPTRDIGKYIKPNVKNLCFHMETQDIEATFSLVKKINSHGINGGIAIDKPTWLSPDFDQSILKKHNRFTIMSVKCGASGQSFEPRVVDFVKTIKAINPGAHVTVDGGVTDQNIIQLRDVGVDAVVVGSYVYKSTNPSATVQHLLLLLNQK
jgi:ribulose-phosphate 3-epimerase